MTEEELFEQWWSKHQDETWEASLTAQERAEHKTHSPIWGCAFKKDARNAWMARAAMTPNVRSQATDAALSRQVACTDGLGNGGKE